MAKKQATVKKHAQGKGQTNLVETVEPDKFNVSTHMSLTLMRVSLCAWTLEQHRFWGLDVTLECFQPFSSNRTCTRTKTYY